jgi:hypothetical protein
MIMVSHANRRTVVSVKSPDEVERTDSRLVSLSHDKVYFVPERRLVRKEDANRVLSRYKNDNAQMTRS